MLLKRKNFARATIASALSILSGICMAMQFLYAELLTGIASPERTLIANALELCGAIILMGYLESRVSGRKDEWGDFKYILAVAAAMCLATMSGIALGYEEGLFRAVVLIPLALVTAHATAYITVPTTK